MQPLPIDSLVSQIVASLAAQPNAVIIAPPGAGKTTRVPSALMALGGGAIVLLQPRRVAARSCAARIASELGVRLGEEVGYQVRFENRTRATTKLRVVTEGILARQLQADPFLDGVSCVVLDEFHERSIHTDVALAMLREVQESARPELRIVVMSATLDPDPVARFLGGAPVFRSEGRMFPVDVQYLGSNGPRSIADDAAQTTADVAAKTSEGHILVFFPGIGEIRRCETQLQERGIAAGFDLHILHSSIAADAQDRAIAPSARRKIVLATNIAETSVTIDGVRTVIDSGYARTMLADRRLGLDRLELRRISMASAAQRAGRAGRTGPGVCIRLWTRTDEAAMDAFDTPEIHRVDLAGTLLSLADFGVADGTTFHWYDAPTPDALARAQALLRMLGAFDATNRLTERGKRLATLPLHPRLGAILLAGAELGVLHEAAGAVALLAEKDPFPAGQRRRDSGWAGTFDLADRLEFLDARSLPAGVDRNVVRHVERVRDELMESVRGMRPAVSTPDPDEALRRAMLHGFPDRVTLRRDRSHGVMVGGRGIELEPSSVVRDGELFLSLDPREPDGTRPGPSEARVSIACGVERTWLPEVFPHLYTRGTVHRFDPDKERVYGIRETRFAGLLLASDVLDIKASAAEASHAFAEYLAPRAREVFASDEDAAALLQRLQFLAMTMPEIGFPALSPDFFAAAIEQSGGNCTSVEQLRRRGLAKLIEDRLDWKHQTALREHAPTHLAVPSGSRIRVNYDVAEGAQPILAVRLQELFGWPETPRIAGGRVPVVLHLLGPNYRPVQITSDLKGFWNGTYAEVRKELRARYPKHPWPEDPWNAPPVAVGRRRS